FRGGTTGGSLLSWAGSSAEANRRQRDARRPVGMRDRRLIMVVLQRAKARPQFDRPGDRRQGPQRIRVTRDGIDLVSDPASGRFASQGPRRQLRLPDRMSRSPFEGLGLVRQISNYPDTPVRARARAQMPDFPACAGKSRTAPPFLSLP